MLMRFFSVYLLGLAIIRIECSRIPAVHEVTWTVIFIIGWRLEAAPRRRCVLLGQSASINCLNSTYNFAINIQWFRILDNGGLQLIPHSRGERVSSNAHQLQFQSTIAEDAGLYCCKTIPETECSPTAVTNVTISLPPVLSPLQNHTVYLGETVAINCTISMGEPTVFTWQKNGRDLPNDSRYTIISSDNGTDLIITNATMVDQGSFSCIVRNWKYQEDNESMYLHVQNPLGCSEINTSYSITIGLQTFFNNCSSIERSILYNVIHKFLQSICNCSDYCLTLDVVNCSPDETVITISMTLKEKQSLLLRSLVYSVLKEGQVKVDQNYSIFCVVKTLCEIQSPPTTMTTVSPTNSATSTSPEVKDETFPAIVIGIVAGIVVMLLILLLLMIILVIFCLQKSAKYKAKQNFKSITHTSNSIESTLNKNTGSSNQHPSTSSYGSGNYLLPDSGSPVSEGRDCPFPPLTNVSNIHCSTSTNPPVSAVRLNATDNKHKVKKQAKHQRSTPLVDTPGSPDNIKWKNNTTYEHLNFHNPMPNSSRQTVTQPPINGAEAKTHYYDDVFGVNESTRRASLPANPNHPQSACNGYNISPGYDVNNKYISTSQV